MFHYKENFQKYSSFPRISGCQFCHNLSPDALLQETTHAYVIKNRIQYDIWELRKVKDHLLVVPKRHVEALHELSQEELFDIMQLIIEYEASHYNVYARAKASKQRSVQHQHTHLIRTAEAPENGLLVIREPYTFVTF